MYRRYSLDEIKHKVIDVLYNAGGTGLSGMELADRTGINRVTMTKYLDVMHAMGLLEKKKIGNVNVWFVEIGIGDLEFPINYIQVQQKMINSILAGDEDQAHRILLNVLNSNIDQVRVMTDVMLPAINTIGELYNRGKLNKTERTFLLSLMMELIDVIKFTLRPAEHKVNAHVVCVAGIKTESISPNVRLSLFWLAGGIQHILATLRIRLTLSLTSTFNGMCHVCGTISGE